MATAPAPKRAEVWLVDFDPAVGAEIRKVRPAVVISSDAIGKLPLRLIVPVTDWQPRYGGFPWFVHLPASVGNGLSKDSGADAFQTKSISLSRFVRRVGRIAASDADAIAAAVAVCVAAP
jgi:mRNA interferase MazF